MVECVVLLITDHSNHVPQGQLIDKVRIYARGGTGGQSSQRVGGVGGDGGSVRVCAVEGSNLADIARREDRRFIAQSGGSCTGGNAFGKRGSDVIVSVPPGTVVWRGDGEMVCDVCLVWDIVSCGVFLLGG